MNSTTENVCWDEESFELLEYWEEDCEEESSAAFSWLGDECGNTYRYDDEWTRDDDDISLLSTGTADRTVAEESCTLWIVDLRTVVESVSLLQVEKASEEEVGECT
jgi:hypothetical protein